MDSEADHIPSPFANVERDLIRREMGLHFGQYPRLADGLLLRTWRGGPHKGEPKLPPAVGSMLERGLAEVRAGRFGPRAFFTEAGLTALRPLLRDRRGITRSASRPCGRDPRPMPPRAGVWAVGA